MANEPNPFEQNPWGGMPQLTPQEGAPAPQEIPQGMFGGLDPGPGGSYFQLSPEAMQMMWAPPQQPQPPPLPGLEA